MEINIPEVQAEVTEAFWRYERALLANDVATLNELFWDSPLTLRLGRGEALYGHEEIARFRDRPGSAPLKREIVKLTVTTFGRDFGTANCETLPAGSQTVGYQSHAWVRMAEGWRIVAAHVSAPGDPSSAP